MRLGDTPAHIARAIPVANTEVYGRAERRWLFQMASSCKVVSDGRDAKAGEQKGQRTLMARLSDTIRLVDLVCARLCHDLGGLFGTVGNALEMVAEDAGRDNEVLAFAASATSALNQRLRLMRTAWGPEVDAIKLPALIKLVTQALAARRIGIDTRWPAGGLRVSAGGCSCGAEPDHACLRLFAERRHDRGNG